MVEKGYLVTKSNQLITSNYDLSVQEQRIILTLASMVQPQDTDFKPYIFKIKDFLKLLNIEDKNKYTEIPKITKELMQKVFEIKQGNKILQLAWLSSAEYEKGTGIVELEFSPKLKPYMLGLKEFYTSYRLENILSLKSKYSIRLYEILKGNLYKSQVEIELEDLKSMVGATANYLKVYADFKNKVILQAQKELSEKTDISFDFEEIKTGRKVTSIKFKIYSNAKAIGKGKGKKVAAADQPADNNIDYVKDIFKEDISSQEAKKILAAAAGDVEKIKEKYSIISQFKQVNNVVGAMITALKENWQSMGKKRIDTFNNFEHRVYDYDELERKLLGWD